MGYLVAIAVVGIVVGVCVAAQTTLGREWAMSSAPPTAIEAGPYRDARVTTWRVRGAPAIVTIAIAANIAWAIVTLAAFVPAGAGLAIVMIGDGWTALGVTSGVVLWALCIDGILVGVALCCNGIALERSGLAQARRAYFAAKWSICHHLAIAAFFGVGGANTRTDKVGWVALAAGLGVLFAGWLAAAGRAAERAELDERDLATP